MSSADNQVIRGYELRELIGTGGFGAVYQAYQAIIRREVAIKIILPQYANHPDFILRFEAEAQLVARLLRRQFSCEVVIYLHIISRQMLQY